jgi:phosphoglycerate dehydrogenase-like enzyme
MMHKKIALSFSSLNDERLDRIMRAAPGYELIDITDGFTDAELSDCEIIFGNVTPEMIKAAGALKWLHTQYAGIEHVLSPEMGLPDSVILTNSSGAYGIGISEHLVTLTLMLMRRMGEYARLQRAGKWENLGAVKTVCNSRVTVVGLGDIGANYAARCRALGARVRGVTRAERPDIPECVDELYTKGNIDAAIDGADVVALCLPGTRETHLLFTKERMLGMKRGALMLNVGRGSAIDQDALIELLETGHIGGAGLDVTSPEPLPPHSKLWNMKNVIITPHVSGGTSLELTLDLIVDRFADYLKDYTAGRAFGRVVDRQRGY